MRSICILLPSHSALKACAVEWVQSSSIWLEVVVNGGSGTKGPTCTLASLTVRRTETCFEEGRGVSSPRMVGEGGKVCGQQNQSNDTYDHQHNPQYANYWAPLTCKRHIQHSPNTPTTGLRERGNDTSGSTGRSGRQNAATRRNMRREERVTVQGPVKEQQPDGMSHRGFEPQDGGGRGGSENGLPSPRACFVLTRCRSDGRNSFLKRV